MIFSLTQRKKLLHSSVFFLRWDNIPSRHSVSFRFAFIYFPFQSHFLYESFVLRFVFSSLLWGCNILRRRHKSDSELHFITSDRSQKKRNKFDTTPTASKRHHANKQQQAYSFSVHAVTLHAQICHINFIFMNYVRIILCAYFTLFLSKFFSLRSVASEGKKWFCESKKKNKLNACIAYSVSILYV